MTKKIKTQTRRFTLICENSSLAENLSKSLSQSSEMGNCGLRIAEFWGTAELVDSGIHFESVSLGTHGASLAL